MNMASLEMASEQTFDCVSSRNKKENNLKVFCRDHLNSCRVFPVDDSGSNEEEKTKEVLECSSRSSVSETGESLKFSFSNPNPTSSPLETNSNQFYNPVQPENQSGNVIIIGASSLVQIWEARSQQPSLSQSQYLINSRTSSGLSLNSISPEEIINMVLRDRENELQWLVDRNTVSKFSPRGCGHLQYMLTIRSLERCIAIQERHCNVNRSSRGPNMMNIRDIYKTNSEKGYAGNVNSAAETQNSFSPVPSQVKKVYEMAVETEDKIVMQETMENSISREIPDATYKPEIAKKPVLSEDAGKKNSLKKSRIEGNSKEEREGLQKAMEKAIVKESKEINKFSLSIAEKVNLWDSKDTTNRRKTMERTKTEGKGARRVIDMETAERYKERRKKENVSSFEEGKAMETEECRINPEEVTLAICLDKRKEEETRNHISKESGKEKKYSHEDDETFKAENQESLGMILESPVFLNERDENAMEDEDNEDFSGESTVHNDWISDVSKPQSHWKDLRKQRELEIMNTNSEKDDIWNLLKRRIVSSCLASDFRKEIDKILILIAQKRLEVESTLVEEEEEEEDTAESLVECSARYQEELEENETAKVDLNSLNPKDHENTSSETQIICDLREQIKQLQREMLELKSLVKSSISFKKSESLSGSVSDSLERNCSVCFEMPIDSLLYRCGHMCTCLRCAHDISKG